jgi:hypothetical protein
MRLMRPLAERKAANSMVAESKGGSKGGDDDVKGGHSGAKGGFPS